MKGKYRLTRAIDFKRVRRFGKSYAHPLAVILVSESEMEFPRIGIITSRAIGKAVERNRVKRQIREIISHRLPEFKKTVDTLIIAREPIRQAGFQEIRNAIQLLMERAELID